MAFMFQFLSFLNKCGSGVYSFLLLNDGVDEIFLWCAKKGTKTQSQVCSEISFFEDFQVKEKIVG